MKKIKLITRNFRFFFPLILKSYPILIILLIFGALLNSAASFVWILLPKEIIGELTGDKDITKLIIIVLIFVISNFTINTLSDISSRICSYYARKADFKIDKMVNDKIMQVDYFRLESPEFKDLVSRAKKGMNEYSSGIYSIIYNLQSVISTIVTISGVIGIIIFSKQYLVMLVSALAIILNYIVETRSKKIEKEFNDSFVRFWRKLNYYNRNIFSFQSQKELRMYNCKKMIDNTCEEENKEAFKRYKDYTKKNQKLWSFEGFVYIFLTRFSAILLLTYSCYKGNITLAVFSMLFSSLETFDGQVFQLISTLKQYFQECEYQNDFIDLMEYKSVFKNGTLKLDELKTIEFKNVSFKYPGCENYVLENLSFKIDNKEKVSLVGLNGSGKTTLIKLLCRFFKVDEGEILINGINIEEYEYENYMQKLAIVFQDFYIISFSVKSNVANIDNNPEKLYDCLKRAGAYDYIMSLDKKEYTYVNKWFDKTGVEFSGGERQKLAIARCLYKDGDFVVLDEPTSALDPLAEAEIYYHFNDIVGKKLTLFISHRLSSCIFSDKILVLDGAKIIETGTHKDLMKNEKSLYKKMFEEQAKYYQE